jgi:membrane-associated protease RseP (regulator of RpoE activity)
MPASPPDSTDSPPPSGTSSTELSGELSAKLAGELPGRAPSVGPSPTGLAWRTNAVLFVVTVGSVFVTGLTIGWSAQEPTRAVAMTRAAEFTAALLGILLAHEFGHFIAAKLHKVDASLPYFLPLPIVSPFGTMGAVIRMRSVIPTRRALLDIGAAGPLAGLLLAIPIYAIGVRSCELVSLDSLGGLGGDSMQFGDSLLTRLLDHWFAPPVPEGMDRLVSPLEHAGWAGMFVTMINLIPVGQLDGGHVAFALLGPRQNRVAQWVQRSMLAFFFVSVASFVARDARAGFGFWHLGRHVNNSLFWLLWFEVLAILGSVSSPTARADDALGVRMRVFATGGLALMAGVFRESTSVLPWVGWFFGLAVLLTMEARWGVLRAESTVLDHPPTSAKPLDGVRAAIAIVTLAFFALLFMPTPIAL